jgi:glycosyltransferase involved in cell wall biosynthesis
MLRVAFDATPLIGERTGIGVLTRGALTALAGRPRLQLRAFALTWRGRAALAGLVPCGVSRVRLPLAAAPLQLAWARIDGPVIEWWTGPTDVVHGTNFVVPPAARAAEVVSVHDLTALRFPEMCQAATLRYPALIRRAIRRGAWVHALSVAMAEEIADLLGAPAERIRVVAPGVDPGPVIDVVSGDAGGGRPYILALGRSEPRKDLPLLVRAFDQIAAGHADLELVLAGPPGWGTAALAEAVATAHHRDRIRQPGWVDDAQKAELLAGATVFAYPSVYEGFGIPPLEAMAAGVAVVATAAGGVPEAVGDAALLVPPGDVDALAAALVTAVEDEAARARLVAAGRQRVAGFSWRRCADGLEALYRDAAEARH